MFFCKRLCRAFTKSSNTLFDPFIKLFVQDKETILIAKAYLQVVAFSQIFSTVEIISNGFFTGIGKPKISSIISVIFTSLRIPMALILIKPFGLTGIWMSIALSSVLKGSVAFILYEIEVKYKQTMKIPY